MGFLPEVTAQELGKCRNSHTYMFTQHFNRLYCTYVDADTGHGILKESRDQGLHWQQTEDLGPCLYTAIRGSMLVYSKATYRLSDSGSITDAPPILGIFDYQTGNVNYEGPVAVTGPNQSVSAVDWSGLPIPCPEESVGGQAVFLMSRQGFNTNYSLYYPSALGAGPRCPGRWTNALWGPEFDSQGGMKGVFQYVDPFFEPISYPFVAALTATSNGIAWKITSGVGTFGTPDQMTFHQDITGQNYEGFMNARETYEGVGVASQYVPPSFFLQADHWIGHDNNSAPLWIPTLLASDRAYRFPISSVPNGMPADNTSSRGAVTGFVNGKRTFGMIEPGYGFAHCTVNGFYRDPVNEAEEEEYRRTHSDFLDSEYPKKFIGNFGERKFLGTFGEGFYRSVSWMPYSSGIFGMGVVAHLDSDPNNAQSIIWISDEEPNKIPTSVLVENGKYTERDDVRASRAIRGDSAYYRW